MKNNRGFTLIEILSVIAIVGIIFTLATAGILKFKENSNNSALQSKKKAIETATLNYALNNSNKIVYDLKQLNGNANCNTNIQNYCVYENGNYYYIYKMSIDYIVQNGIYEEKNKNNSCSVVNPVDNTCLTGFINVKISANNTNYIIASYSES